MFDRLIDWSLRNRPLILLMLVGLIATVILKIQGLGGASLSEPVTSTEDLSRVLFHELLLPFEVTSVLILVAILGAVALVAGDETYIAFLLGGVVALLSGYSYAKLAARYPDAGGLVAFFNRAFGGARLSGTLSLAYLLTIAASIALVAKAFGAYAAALAFGDANSFWIDASASSLTILLVLLNIAGSGIAGKAELLEGLGLGEGALPRVTRAAYQLLGRSTFLTTGEQESRAWTFRNLERMNLLLELVLLRARRLDDTASYAADIRHFLIANDGWPRRVYRDIYDTWGSKDAAGKQARVYSLRPTAKQIAERKARNKARAALGQASA